MWEPRLAQPPEFKRSSSCLSVLRIQDCQYHFIIPAIKEQWKWRKLCNKYPKNFWKRHLPTLLFWLLNNFLQTSRPMIGDYGLGSGKAIPPRRETVSLLPSTLAQAHACACIRVCSVHVFETGTHTVSWGWPFSCSPAPALASWVLGL